MRSESPEKSQHKEVLLSSSPIHPSSHLTTIQPAVQSTTPQTSPDSTTTTPTATNTTTNPTTLQSLCSICIRNKLRTYLIIRITVRILIVIGMILLLSLVKWDLPEWLRKYGRQISRVGGAIPGGILFTVCATLFCTVSPLGYLPAVITGMVFPFYISPLITWISVYVGSILNAILIRKLNKYHYVSRVVDCLVGTKRGRIAYLEAALRSDHALKIVIFLRAPFMSNGTLNYLLALSTVPLATLIKANAIGFVPGSILFAVFGRQIRSLLTMIYHVHRTSVSEWVVSLMVLLIALCCYAFVIWKVRKVIKMEARKYNEVEDDDDGGGSEKDKEEDKLGPRFEFETIDTGDVSPDIVESDSEL